MSAPKSNMPNGTRQAALVAFCLAACLLAWQGSTLLTKPNAGTAPQTSVELLELQSLIEPVLGRDAMRLATHTNDDGARSILILVDAEGSRFHLGAEKTERIEMILTAATGFDPARDTLQIQPFEFAPGTTGKASMIELIELAALFLVTGLLGFIAFRASPAIDITARPREPAPSQDVQADRASAHLRAIPLEGTASGGSAANDAQRLAREDPKRTATIIRSWLHDGSAS